MLTVSGPASDVDMHHLITIKHAKNKNLKAIYELSLIQHEILDTALLENMYHEHKSNQPKNEKPLKKAVIVGAGPSGLYAAFQLYLSGVNITLVNDRKDYIRNQIVQLDSNYMLQLKMFLGTKFEKLFYGKYSPGILTQQNGGQISLKHLEKAFKDRL
uniref:Uncharacterized protein n=1 Tax=Ditylenchus dipsaci TaxID=166011 RepID=A0A915DER0_9BILA